jgi:transposase
MIFVGDDWAEDHHDIHVMDADGARLASRRLPEGLPGISRFHELVAAHVEEPSQVVIGIETDRGLWVQALGAAGYQVYAVNPLAVAHYRDRHQVSGAKSDAGDAKLLADLVRTDRHNHRLMAGDSSQAEAIKVLARGHQNLIWARTRHTNALRSALREYYPAALEAFEDLHDRDALAVLGRAPTPTQAAHLSLTKIRSALKRAGRQRNLDARAQEIAAALRTEQLAAPTAITAAFAATTRAAVGIITELNRQIAELETSLGQHFETHPDADIYRSLPGLGVILGARVLGEFGDDPNRYTHRQVSQKLRRNITTNHRVGQEARRAGPPRPQPPPLRRPRPMGPLRTPEQSRSTRLLPPPPRPPETCTIKPYGLWATASSASCTAAYATAPSTTNTPPGHTAKPPRLDVMKGRGLRSS